MAAEVVCEDLTVSSKQREDDQNMKDADDGKVSSDASYEKQSTYTDTDVRIKEEPVDVAMLGNVEGTSITRSEPTRCYVCDLPFDDEMLLSKHLDEHAANSFPHNYGGSKDFKCHICQRVFSKKQTLKRHAILHSGIKPFKCAFCTHSTYRKDHLQAHIRIKHLSGRSKQTKCSVCNTVFSSHQSLANHMKSHRNANTCLHCGDEFYSTGALASHIRNHHNGNNGMGQLSGTVYTCEPCRFTTSSASLYDMHLQCEKHRVTVLQLTNTLPEEDGKEARPVVENFPTVDEYINDAVKSSLHDLQTAEKSIDSVDPVIATPMISNVMSLQTTSVSLSADEHSSPSNITTSSGQPSAISAILSMDSGHVSSRSSLSNSPTDVEEVNMPSRPISTSPDVLIEEPDKRGSWNVLSAPRRESGNACSSLLLKLVTNNAKAVLRAKTGQSPKPLGMSSSNSQWKSNMLCDSSTQDDVWRCSHCHIIFPDNVMYTIHMGCHGLKSPFQCNICALECYDKYEFASHIARGQHKF
ncbi:uncharacterized protein LOC102807491 [Saccoglossus kowalevskii]|uniref:DNA-binding protein Ikaros-like n=1 Tax=Saccoglossus kowalevskii TaxID=10224 RepID=A0ABM0MJQ3_SACKO|nr:PREDICTED: DNA-binding protein Ikaros-like [Saccoglossus kowalevskii]